MFFDKKNHTWYDMISMPILSRAKSYAWAIFSLRKKTNHKDHRASL